VLTADEIIAVVRVHADRVHDAVRRLGCAPEAAAQVVEQSAIDLVTAAERQGENLGDPVGWWFARARALGRKAAGGDDDLPVGGGVLSGDANQLRLAEALEQRPERDRAALLLRDSYALPVSAVGAVLSLDPAGTMRVVGQARLSFLAAFTQRTPLHVGDHVDVGSLARLAEGGQARAHEATTRRHVHSCQRCAEVLEAQERARRLLAGLTVVALADADRDALLATVERRATAQLPAAVPLSPDEEDEEPPKRYSLSLMTLGLVLASGLGIAIGALASGGEPSVLAVDQEPPPLVTAAPVLVVGPASPTATPSPTPPPTPRVFVVTPSPQASPTASATPSADETVIPLSLSLSPTSGPVDTVVTVSGQGWTPNAVVTVRFQQANGATGAEVSAQTDGDGSFQTQITAHDQSNIAGPRNVVADDGVQQAQATFTVTPI
jgi:DNA-directed RNA polymerase specialized sigma24 family protein